MPERVRTAAAAAASAAGAEAGDCPARNCATAAAASRAAAIWQEVHTHWLGEVKTTGSRFFVCLETYAGDANGNKEHQQHSSYQKPHDKTQKQPEKKLKTAQISTQAGHVKKPIELSICET